MDYDTFVQVINDDDDEEDEDNEGEDGEEEEEETVADKKKGKTLTTTTTTNGKKKTAEPVDRKQAKKEQTRNKYMGLLEGIFYLLFIYLLVPFAYLFKSKGLYENKQEKPELKISFDSTFGDLPSMSDEEDESMDREMTFTPGLDDKAQQIIKDKEVLLIMRRRRRRKQKIYILFYSLNKNLHGINIWKNDMRNKRQYKPLRKKELRKLKLKLLKV